MYRLPKVKKKRESKKNVRVFWRNRKNKAKVNPVKTVEVSVIPLKILEKVVSVPFVPRTPHSKLAKIIRKY